MSERTLTIVAEGREAEVAARLAPSASGEGGPVRVSAADLRRAIGVELEPEGVCAGDLCFPVASRDDLVTADGIDLVAVAEVLGRPLAIDRAEGVAVLGASAGDRARDLASLEAPDFTLPDLDGRERSLSEFRGRKVFLLAFASW
jgi:hypothetical protein